MASSETIYLPGYTTLEKRRIAMDHLIPKQVLVNGLNEEQVTFTDEVVSKIIESYTREAGVRNLEREIGSVCRSKAVEYADAIDAGRTQSYKPQLTVEDVENILGIEKFEEEIAEKTGRPGIVTGLVAYSSGGNGSILFIEVADMPGSGTVQLTGKLGDVLKESVEVALTWVKAHAFELGLTHEPSENIMKNRSIHVHCPSGSIPKDGPSSGLAQAMALISLFSGRAVPPTMAMTVSFVLLMHHHKAYVRCGLGGLTQRATIGRDIAPWPRHSSWWYQGEIDRGAASWCEDSSVASTESQGRKGSASGGEGWTGHCPREVGVFIAQCATLIFGPCPNHIANVSGLRSHIWEAIRHIWPDAHWPEDHELPGFQSRL